MEIPQASPLQVSNIRQSIALSLVERYVSIGLSLVSFVVIARLLTPNDIGLYSLAAAIIGLAQVMRDFGVVAYVIQEPELSPARIRTAFGVTCVMSLALCCITVALAPFAAIFYNDARLLLALRVLAINFLFLPFGSISLALLRREMQFGAICVINLGAAVGNFGVAMALAYVGSGYLSLVWASVASAALTSILAVWYKPNDALLVPSFSEWRRVMGFGSQMTFTSVITEVSMNINDLVIGRVMGVTAVAFVSRAQGVMNLMHRDLLGAVAGVMFPALSKVRREGGNPDDAYQRCVAIMSVVAWPFYGFLALFPDDALLLLFGPQWGAAVPLVPLFCIAGAAGVFWKIVPALLQALGRADLVMRAELIIQPFRIVLLIAAVSIFESLMVYAAGFAFVYVGCIFVFEHYRRVAIPGAGGFFPSPLRKSLLVTFVALAVPGIVAILQRIHLAGSLGTVAYLFLVVLSALLWTIACRAVRHPISVDPAFEFLWNLLRKFGRK